MCVGVRRFECAGVVVLVTIERAEAARQLYLAGVIWNSMVRCCVENGTEQPLRRTVQSSSRTPVSLSKSSRILLQLELNLSLSDSATFLNPLCDRWTPPVWLKNTPTSPTEHPRCTISPLSDLAACNRASEHSAIERRGVVFFHLESSFCCLVAWPYLGLHDLVSDPLATLGK